MLNDELRRWEPYAAWFDPDQTGWPVKVTRDTDEYTGRLSADEADIQQAWLAVVFSPAEEKVLVRYFQYHQRRIIALAARFVQSRDLLSSRSPAEDLDRHGNLLLLQLLLDRLDSLLRFLEMFYPDYLLENVVLPAGWERRPGVPIVGGQQRINTPRIPVQLSVAQLACFLRLGYEHGFFPRSSITDLVRFAAAHFQTKRRSQISPGSLSKEYYTVSQVTAAVCRGYLEQAVQRINKEFFP